MEKTVVNIDKDAAIDKIVENKMKDILVCKNILKYGFDGFYSFSKINLERFLKNIDDTVQWKIN